MRFFVPEIFLPQKFNYFICLPEDIEKLDKEYIDDCVICMNSLYCESINLMENLKTNKNPLFIKLKNVKHKIMKTPCSHKFHIACLIEWMNIKMECPTCRKNLPCL